MAWGALDMFSADPSAANAPDARHLSIDVTEADFRQTVLERSLEVLGDHLEKVAQRVAPLTLQSL